ncbi:32185_t:CDS:1, partial [Gigaspora margarita]
HKKNKRKIYLYEKITEENWKNFSDEIDRRISKSTLLNDSIENGEKLNKQWHNWNNIVKRTTNAMILFTFSSP